MGASYHSHKDIKFFGIGRILQEVHTGFLFLDSPSHMVEKEGGLHVDLRTFAEFLRSEAKRHTAVPMLSLPRWP